MRLDHLYSDGLPSYDSIRESLRKAVEETLDKDYDLLALGGHEQAIAHRIAVYLERSFTGFHTDCEYNRNKHKAKGKHPEMPGNQQNMRPDIIVHRRNKPENVLAVEMKAKANEATNSDLDKLKCLKGERTYLYKGVAFVCVHNSVSEMEEGTLSATISWYEVKADAIVEEVENRQLVSSTAQIVEVKKIIQQRREREKPA